MAGSMSIVTGVVPSEFADQFYKQKSSIKSSGNTFTCIFMLNCGYLPLQIEDFFFFFFLFFFFFFFNRDHKEILMASLFDL